MDDDDQTWGSVGGEGDLTATVDAMPVKVAVSVSADEDYRVQAWSDDFSKDVAIVLDEANAVRLRDRLTEALRLGVWAV